MSENKHQKIDSFYLALAIVSVALAAILIVTFRGIFSAVITAYEIDSAKTNDVRVNKDKLEEAFNKAFQKEYTKLKIE